MVDENWLTMETNMQLRDSEQYTSLAKDTPKAENLSEEVKTGIDLDTQLNEGDCMEKQDDAIDEAVGHKGRAT